METITFLTEENEPVELAILEQTKIHGTSYLLVAEQEGESCFILKDTSKDTEAEALYQIIEDEVELEGVLKVFEELLEDIEIER